MTMRRKAFWTRSHSFGALIAIVILSLGNVSVRAEIQVGHVGFSTNHAFEGTLEGENIDIMNGNVNLRIPIGQRYMLNDWFGYQLQLYYNSKIWSPHGVPCTSDCGEHLVPTRYGAGFILHFGRIYHHPDDFDNIYRYQSPDGSERFFCHQDAGDPPCYISHRTFDSSSMRVEGNGLYWDIYPGDGTRIRFDYETADPYDPTGGLLVSGGKPWGGWYATSINASGHSQREHKI